MNKKAIIVIALVINGLPKQSEGEKQAQTNAQEIIKLVNTFCKGFANTGYLQQPRFFLLKNFGNTTAITN